MTPLQILTKYWGFTSFRPFQEEVIQSVLGGRDTLALMPTGGGKSLCYQVPALAAEGICLVISPLIALMKDQVENLRKQGIIASALHSGMSQGEIEIALNNCLYGKTKLLYISPERLLSEKIKSKLHGIRVSMIAVDEAHCISQWGYDFRPAYLEIAGVREIKPDIPLLALTATATREVIADIQEKLRFKKEHVIRRSFRRENLAYMVLKEENKQERLLKILSRIKGGSIIYVRSRKKTKEISDFLQRKKIVSDFYHAGLKPEVRSRKQENWSRDKTRIMVCTNAFGMGIDKSNVRVVIHYDLPESPEAYFQEAGRAGRDEKKAYAVLLFNDSDILELRERIAKGYPTPEEIRNTYQALANFFQIAEGAGEFASFDFDIYSFCHEYNFDSGMVFNSLKILVSENYISTSDAVFLPSKIHFNVNKNDLYTFQVSHEKLDPFIKVLLRSYTGVFDDYVKINESEIARRAGMSREEAIKNINYLRQTGIVSYVKSTDKPQITFTQPRVDVQYLFIDQNALELRKKRAEARMDTVIKYITSVTQCRSRLLLRYFGEKDTARCGVCDVCLNRNKLDLNNVEFENVSSQVKEILFHNPQKMEETVNLVRNSKEKNILKVIQWLLDNNKIRYNEEQKLIWCK